MSNSDHGATRAVESARDATVSDKSHFWKLTLGSVGVVYGDIGTSPLYAFREAVVAASPDGQILRTTVLGVLSLIIWSLLLVVTLKYVLILLRADNRGEGGTLALMALAQRALGRSTLFVTLLGVIGAALFYGDAVITPAISVLSAVEGLKLVTSRFEPYVVIGTVLILGGLFAVQSRGTAKVAAYFGPITALWFLAMAATGIAHIADDPGVIAAFNPFHAVVFVSSHGVIGLIALGAVFLAVTGAEALYADLGHFGKGPIRLAWLGLVMPALVLNYLGQGAFVLSRPETIENPFYLMAPEWALVPMIGLATAATVIASQAVITGAYSLTRQAVQLGLLPRMEVRHTSESLSGQIYMPVVNWLLLAGVIVVVALFKSSSALAAAYGISVTGTMVVTAMMAFVVVWRAWGYSPIATAIVVGPLLFLDGVFLAANLLKLLEGGWVPVLMGAAIVVVMLTWRRGSRILLEKSRRAEVPFGELTGSLEARSPQVVPGTAVFLTSDPESAPSALMHSLKHYKVLHERNVILSVRYADVPRVAETERVAVTRCGTRFLRLDIRFGFMESPNVPRALAALNLPEWKYEAMSTSFFLSRRQLRASGRYGMPLWQDNLFILLARNANDASSYFRIPTNRVVEIGTQVTI